MVVIFIYDLALTLDSFHISHIVLLDIENVVVAVGILLLSCI